LTRNSGCRCTSLAAQLARFARAERSCSSAERVVAGRPPARSSWRSPPRCPGSPGRSPSSSRCPRQSNRPRLRRHAAVGIAAGRSSGRTSRATSYDAANRARGRPGRHSHARRPPFDEHSGHPEQPTKSTADNSSSRGEPVIHPGDLRSI
jgi:hypothetical protein